MMFNENNGFDSLSGHNDGSQCSVEVITGSYVDASDQQKTALATEKDAPAWVLYLLECQHDTFYCGITNNMESRFKAHRAGKGARFTRANPPIQILAAIPFTDRSAASKAEYQLKQQRKSNKINWIKQQATLNAQKLKENQL